MFRIYLRWIESKLMVLFAHDFITCLLIGRENLLLFNCFYSCACFVSCIVVVIAAAVTCDSNKQSKWMNFVELWEDINCNNKHSAPHVLLFVVVVLWRPKDPWSLLAAAFVVVSNEMFNYGLHSSETFASIISELTGSLEQNQTKIHWAMEPVTEDLIKVNSTE